MVINVWKLTSSSDSKSSTAATVGASPSPPPFVTTVVFVTVVALPFIFSVVTVRSTTWDKLRVHVIYLLLELILHHSFTHMFVFWWLNNVNLTLGILVLHLNIIIIYHEYSWVIQCSDWPRMKFDKDNNIWYGARWFPECISTLWPHLILYDFLIFLVCTKNCKLMSKSVIKKILIFTTCVVVLGASSSSSSSSSLSSSSLSSSSSDSSSWMDKDITHVYSIDFRSYRLQVKIWKPTISHSCLYPLPLSD